MDQGETATCSILSEGTTRLGAQAKNPTPDGDILDISSESRVRQEYPIRPWRTADEELPFVPADEVAKRNGQDGAKLCSSIVLKINRRLIPCRDRRR